MKNLILVLGLMVAGICAKAQSLTVHNYAGCHVNYSIIASTPGTCNMADNSTTVVLAAGTSAAYPDASFLMWAPITPPSNAKWVGITVLDDGQLKLYDEGDACTGKPSSGSFPWCGGTVSVSYTVDNNGNVTINFN